MMHPEFFTSPTLARVDLRAAMTFAGLWIYVDDFGRGEDDPAFVAATVYPRRDDVGRDEVAQDLVDLARIDTVCRYTVGGFALLHVPSWFEHQKVSHPTPSKLPPCPSCELTLYRSWYRDNDTASERFRKAEKAARAAKTSGETLSNGSGTDPEALRNDSAQCSVVKSSLVKGAPRGTVREFRRRSAG